jgi:hypothetical protein
MHDLPPETQPSGSLEPPRRYPPTAVGAAMEPEPEPERSRALHRAVASTRPFAALRLPFVIARAALRATGRALERL